MSARTVDILKLITAIAVSQLAGIIGSVFTVSSVGTWYAGLRKPGFTPPSWLFGPVWITLYALMGIAAWLVWRKGLEHRVVRIALALFLVQLVLNTLWSVIFFGAQAPLYAFIEIIFLWLAIVLTMVWFFRVSTYAGILLIPYIVWVSYATVLNGFIWNLNQ